MKILAVQNCEVERFGLYADIIRESGYELIITEAYKGEGLGDPGNYAAVLIGGTPISVRDADNHVFLREEKEFLREALQNDIPCLGICFGAQLLASLFGSKTKPLLRKEIGCYAVIITEDGINEPMLSGFPGTIPVFQWHSDTFDIPEGGVLLAEGIQCRNQLFKIKNSFGIQFHLEVEKSEAAKWAEVYSDELADVGTTFERIVQNCEINSKKMKFLASLFMNNFLHFYVKKIPA